MLGAAGTWVGWDRADAIVGLGISIAILAVLRGAARQIYYRLMDAVDTAITPGVRAVHETKVRWLGHRLVTDLTIDVDGAASVGDGHAVATAARQRLLDRVAHIDEVHVHVHPARRTSAV